MNCFVVSRVEEETRHIQKIPTVKLKEIKPGARIKSGTYCGLEVDFLGEWKLYGNEDPNCDKCLAAYGQTD